MKRADLQVRTSSSVAALPMGLRRGRVGRALTCMAFRYNLPYKILGRSIALNRSRQGVEPNGKLV